LKATNTDIAIEKYLSAKHQFLIMKNFSFIEDTKNGPTTITLSLNHHINLRCNLEY